MVSDSPKYKMTLSLNILRHLGIGLYSNVPAVLSEVVANAWDADAENVSIVFSSDGDRITIKDDGHGMSVRDANKRYLNVGYERRKADQGSKTQRFQRDVMGRKGIGKLSLFSIAKTVEVHTVKGNERHGFRMEIEAIEETIRQEEEGTEVDYTPTPIAAKDVKVDQGTLIVLTDLKRQLSHTARWLRRRLARRFSIIGAKHNFEVTINGEPISLEDREYHDKLQYIWTYGVRGIEVRDSSNNLRHRVERSGQIHVNDTAYSIDGWIGTATEAGQLKDRDTNESINGIIVIVRGKLAQEDILDEFGEGGLYSKYVLGEIHADFLDQDEEDDIATTEVDPIVRTAQGLS